jgi:putative Ig domain-containing protein/immunoglobulin I-set domain protein
VLPNATQSFTLTVNPAPGTVPVITTHPTSVTVTAGATATFTAAASGSPTPTVQWQLSTNGTTWSNITGATSTSYTTLATTTAMDGYRYRAVFTNSAGTATSNPASLTVNPQDALAILTTALPGGTVGQPYSAQLQAQGGTRLYTWRATGNFPRGLTLSTSGAISGTPNRAGTYSFTVRLTDSASGSVRRDLTATIAR